MCRHQLRFLSSALTLPLMALWLAGCTRLDDVVPATYPLQKGLTLNQPALMSVGLKEFTGITIGNNQDRILADLKNNRPTQISDYLNSTLFNPKIIELVPVDSVTRHLFAWSSTKRKVMMVALLKNVIQVNDNQLANPQDIVWLWTPPAGTTDQGSVRFSSGQLAAYSAGKFNLSDVKSNPLKPGIYVWAVWAWDDKAISIVASSRELPFQIK